MSIQDRYRLWSENPYFDKETRQELKQISDPQEIEERFYMDLEFGTGGLRGIMAAGTNRMNKYVIRKATQGLAECVCDQPEGMTRGVVIAFDSRKYSTEFALEAALVIARNGVKAYLFEALRPTPELSFAVRQLHAQAGIVVTASHNSKGYNGFKVYWEDGGQVPPVKADQILARIEARENWLGLEPMSIEQAKSSGLLEIIGEEIDRPYLARVLRLALHPDLDLKKGADLRIIYTPLHGAGNVLVRRALAELGFSSVTVVPEQELPDPEFTTVPYPNPEIPATFELARKYGTQMQADLLLATDPDGDRLGVVLRDPQKGEYTQLTGNQIGVLLTYYILSQKKALGILPENAVIIKTVASTDLADEVARYFNVRVENVLTGFKFIAEKEKEMEEEGWGTFQFGFEESYGYLAGDFVRDKDAIIASVLLAEAALYYQQVEGRSLFDVLESIYKQFGYYLDDQESLSLEGIQGKEEMAKIMSSLRQEEILQLGGINIERFDDYEERIRKEISTGLTYSLELPRSNVLRYSFNGGGFVMVRPSGTEPKIKFYFSVKADTLSEAEDTLRTIKADVMHRIALIRSV